MTPERIRIESELHTGRQPGRGLFYLDDCVERLEALRGEFAGKIKLIYMDPPYLTGDRFYMRVRVGQQGWEKRQSAMQVVSFIDPRDRGQYLAFMRRVLELCKALLSDEGMIFVHVDWRLNPHLRLLMDELFGEENFLNEIIWVYQTGGRSVRHFSRKHDVILFYRKTERYDFNIDAVKAVPDKPRSNHMKRHVDPDGRTYRTIRVGGKEYAYYDDDPVAPSDVWTDLSHLQQKDPERTGYDTQKPLSLLDRVVRCASREGDWVLDPFAGSSTTLEAARRNGRNFIGIDSQPVTVNILRRRLNGAHYAIRGMDNGGDVVPVCEVDSFIGVGFYHVILRRFEVPVPGLPEDAQPMDCVDNWSVGYLREDGYEVMSDFVRTRRHAALRDELVVPMFAGTLAVCVSDVLGRSWYFRVADFGDK